MTELVKRKRGRDRTPEEKSTLSQFCLSKMTPKKKRLTKEVIDQACVQFDIGERLVRSIVKQWKDSNDEVMSFRGRRKGNCGVQNLQLTEEIRDCIFEFSAELNGDFTYRSFNKKFGQEYGIHVSHKTMYNWFQLLGVKISHSYLKPLLSDVQIAKRLEWVLNKVESYWEGGETKYRFQDEGLRFRLDEKWFYVKRDKKKFKLLPGQTAQEQAVRHKSHIVKIIFVAVIGVPQTLQDGTWFDGKLGIWPMTEMAPAERNSVNRPAGAPVITPVNMSCETYRHLCLGGGGVIEKIKQKLGCCRNASIVIQHDGATPHTGEGTEAALNIAGVEGGWNIQWERQPAQSPDCNKCDLGFFASLQKKVFEANTDMKSMADLTNAMMTAANEYDWQTLERLHGTQYAIFLEILKSGGKNDYKLPHTGVTTRQSRGEVVADLRIPTNIFNFARNRLAELNDA